MAARIPFRPNQGAPRDVAYYTQQIAHYQARLDNVNNGDESERSSVGTLEFCVKKAKANREKARERANRVARGLPKCEGTNW